MDLHHQFKVCGRRESPRHGLRLRIISFFVVLAGILVPPLAAQTSLYWDTNGTTAGAGGTTPSGTWKTTGSNANWNTVSAGTGTTANWTNNSIAVFSAGTDATGSYTVSVAGNPDVDSILIQEGNIIFDGSSLTLTGTTPSIDVGSGLTATFNTKLSGSNGLVKNGAGTLVLNSLTNNWTGDTLINVGSVQLGAGTNILPNATGVVIASGASLTIVSGGANEQVGSLSGAGSLDYADNFFKVGDASNTTFSGTLTGSGTFRKLGTGSLTLSGNNTAFTGALDLNAGGNLILAHSNALGTATAGNDIASGAALQFSGGINVTETDFTIRGTGTDGTGVLRSLSGNNSLTAALSLATANNTISADAGSTFTLNGGIDHGSRNLTIAGAGNTTITGALTGLTGAQLIKDDAGTLTLSGASANTIGGTFSINNGTVNLSKTGGINATGSTNVVIGDGVGAAASAHLVLQSYQQIPDAAALTINSDGRLALNNFSEIIETVSGTGLIDLGASGSLTIGTANGSSTFGGSITGTGTVTKAGTGTLTFNSSLNFSGSLILSGGTIAFNGYNLTVGTLHITGDTVLDFGNSAATVLNATNFIVDAGVTVTINNWVNTVDYFYAQNWSGATLDTSGSAPMNQVSFTGFSSADTHWQSYDRQITPAPEPAAFGALLMAFGLLLTAVRRQALRLAGLSPTAVPSK
jgi:fibronectin-binding autotransporter adhesin